MDYIEYRWIRTYSEGFQKPKVSFINFGGFNLLLKSLNSTFATR